MKALLLAAGLGTRLGPLTDTIPKCLVPIRGRPLLDIWLDHLRRAGIDSVLVNTHHLAQDVARYVRRSDYRDYVTLVHEPALLGTGGTLLANRDFFDAEPVLVAHADNLCVCDLRAFVQAHRNRPAPAVMTMMTFLTETPESCGIVQLDGQGLVIEFEEKPVHPRGNLANGAVYVLEPVVVDFLATLAVRTIDFSIDVVPHFVERIFAWHNAGIHRDIGTQQSLQAAQLEWTPSPT